MNEAGEMSERDSRNTDWVAKLSEACFYITSKSDLNDILQVVVDGACAITGGSSGTVELFDSPALRNDYQSTHAGSAPDVGTDAPAGEDSPVATLEVPLLLGRESIGALRIYEKEGGGQFTSEDEQALQIITPLATLAISNAVRYWSDHKVKVELEALVDASPIGVVVLDVHTGAPQAVNHEARRMFNALFEDELELERNLGEVTLRRSDGREMTLSEVALGRASGPGETVRSERVLVKSSEGTLSVLMNVTPIMLDDGEVVSVVVTFRDEKRNEGTEGLRSDLLGLVSHELRTPLTTIKGSAATALGSSSPLDAAEMRQFFRIIDQQANHLRSLIRNLHDLARIEDGTLSISIVPCDVAAILNQARNTFEGVGASGSVEIQTSSGLPFVGADKQRILQVLNGTLSYASRFSLESSPLRLAAQQNGSFLEFSVEYYSRGVPLADLSALFERGDRSEEGRFPETNDLELSVCRGIVEAHGGKIWFDSVGGGLAGKFVFALPVVEVANGYGDQVGDQTGEEAGRAAVSNLPQVLVLDNDPQTLAYTRDALMAAGFAALVTVSPDEAYRLLEDERPQAVLLDLMIPGMEGAEVIERIPKVVDVPVIFLSDRGRELDVEKAFEKGGDDYIVKPFLASELVSRVRAAIRKRELHNQPKASEVFQLGDVTINYGERSVSIAGRPVQLTATEYKLLFEFSISGGRVLTHDQLLRRVWGMSYEGDTRLLRAFVKSLRRKLGDDAGSPSYIFTEPGVGYRLAKA